MNPDSTSQSSNVPPASTTPAHGAHKNAAMAILAYIGPLVIVSFVTAKDDPFVKFHIKQGLILLAIEIAVWILSWFFIPFFVFWMLLRLVNLIVFILAIIGIIYAVKGEEKELPVIGHLARHFKF